MSKSGGICYSIFMKKGKEHLIPLEKSRRVIYLDRRGAEVKNKYAAAAFFGVLGVFCFIYFIFQLFFVNTGSNFFMIWSILAAGCGLLAFFLAHRSWVARIPKWLRRIIVFMFAMGIALFLAIEGMILSRFGGSEAGSRCMHYFGGTDEGIGTQ